MLDCIIIFLHFLQYQYNVSMKKRRRRSIERCITCGLSPDKLCLCEHLPTIDIPVEFIIIQHQAEFKSPSNTGRLVNRMLKNSHLIHFGIREIPLDKSVLQQENTQYAVLYPREESEELSPEVLNKAQASGEKLSLILLDSTWSQAASMARRVPIITDYPYYSLPLSGQSKWGIRDAKTTERFCTLEAALMSMETLGLTNEAETLNKYFKLIRGRHLHLKGKINKKELEKIQAKIGLDF